jgi:hypothetical protein
MMLADIVAGIIASCPSRRNDEWLCEKNAMITYMAVYLYDYAPSLVP